MWDLGDMWGLVIGWGGGGGGDLVLKLGYGMTLYWLVYDLQEVPGSKFQGRRITCSLYIMMCVPV